MANRAALIRLRAAHKKTAVGRVSSIEVCGAADLKVSARFPEEDVLVNNLAKILRVAIVFPGGSSFVVSGLVSECEKFGRKWTLVIKMCSEIFWTDSGE